MQQRGQFTLITFYKFVDIAEPVKEVKQHGQFCRDIGMMGRIYIGEEGISATATCNAGQLAAYKLYLQSNPYFSDVLTQIDEKASKVDTHMFDKMIVRYRQEIVALGITINQAAFERSVQELTVAEFKQVLDTNDPERIILDMRNNYEHKLGHFKGALPAGTINFREVEDMFALYREKFANKKVLMYCTGGIRCDKLSVLLKEHNIGNFYGLQGGIVKYINTYNDGNWLGNLYTFDGVISKKVGDDQTHTTIGECVYSGLKTDNCENCRYSPCNARIIARHKQFKRFGGFCSFECFENAKQDGLVKNDSFDTMDYKTLRKELESGKLKVEDFIKAVSVHLDAMVGTLRYPHAMSQKEDIVDQEYLSQWLAKNGRGHGLT